MIGSLSRRERTLITVSVVAALLILGWELAILPVLERERSAAELLPVREQILVRRKLLVKRKNDIVRDLAATNARVDALSTKFLTAPTPAVAASELQKLVKDVAAAAANEVRSERILPPVDRGELLEVPIEITVSSEIRQLVDLLSRLEQAPKVLTVQDVKIRVVNLAQPKDLLTTLTLSGYILLGKTKA